MRRSGLSLRAIAEALRGSPGLSDFKGVVVPSVPPSSRVTQSDDQKELRLSFTGDALASAPSAGNAGAIVAAIVSEYAASAHSAQLESDVTYDGRGRWENQRRGEFGRVYSTPDPRDRRNEP